MTVQEILDLGKMGFTKDDIEKMNTEPEQEPKEEPKEEPKQEPKEEPKQETQQEPKQDNSDGIVQLTNTINDLIKSIQAGNIINSNNHSGDNESAEQILGSIIQPPLKKGEKNK